jgi:hypothetical protein
MLHWRASDGKKIKARRVCRVHPKEEPDQHPQDGQEGQRCEGRSERFERDRQPIEAHPSRCAVQAYSPRGPVEAHPPRCAVQALSARGKLTPRLSISTFAKGPEQSGPFAFSPELARHTPPDRDPQEAENTSPCAINPSSADHARPERAFGIRQGHINNIEIWSAESLELLGL